MGYARLRHLHKPLIVGNLLLSFGHTLSDTMSMGETGGIIGMGLVIVYILALRIPSLALAVRRLHDSGTSGWLLLVTFVPFVGGIILLVFMCLDSEPNTNRWGPNPKVGDGGLSDHLIS